MIVLIAYDVTSDRRRSKIARLLANHGERIQYSVFECELIPDLPGLLWPRPIGW